jgi:predicted DNA-binding protein (MmcQ/YjbR family)
MESLEEEIFKGYQVNLSSLPSQEFKQEKEGFIFSSLIMDGDFSLQVIITPEGKVYSHAIDTSSNSIYTIYKVPSASGEYVGKVRQEIRQTLKGIRDKYFTSTRYSPLVLSLFSFVKDKYLETPSYPFGEDNTAIFRHQKTKKWYGLILRINYLKIGGEDEVGDLLIVKGDVSKINHKTIFRGFHMNQKKWISYPLDGRVSLSELEEVLALSYDKK